MSKEIDFGIIKFKSKKAQEDFYKKLLRSYRDKKVKVISDEDAVYLYALIEHHPNAIEKIGSGIHHFYIQKTYPKNSKDSSGFHIYRTDGSSVSFTYKIYSKRAKSAFSIFRDRAQQLRIPESAKIIDKNFGGRSEMQCNITKQFITKENAFVQHYPTPLVCTLKVFLDHENLTITDDMVNDGHCGFADQRLVERWLNYYRNNATVRVVSKALLNRIGETKNHV